LLQEPGLVDDENRIFRRERLEQILAREVAKRVRVSPVTAKDRLLPPRPRITRRLGPHPARLAPHVTK
jgi:hypothetical protein